MKHKNPPVPLLPILLLMFSCTQSPIFLYISEEYPPIESAIGGSPSQIVEHDGKLYVANNAAVYECDPTMSYKWEAIPTPGRVKMLASTGSSGDLYALGWPGSPDARTIWKYNGTSFGSVQTTPPSDTDPQQIYGANGVLFIGTPNRIYSWDGTTLTDLGSSGALLQGAVYDGSDYYLGTYGRGIYKVVAGDISTLNALDSISSADHYHPTAMIKGMIKLTSDIVAVSTSDIYYKDTGPTYFNKYIPSSGLSGAIALWDYGANQMLLFGLEDARNDSSSYPYGYRELILTSGAINSSDERLLVPGNEIRSVTSINPHIENTSAIGNNPVTSIFATRAPAVPNPSDGRPIIFASTQMRGLWSYRDRPFTSGSPQWNGEDNN